MVLRLLLNIILILCFSWASEAVGQVTLDATASFGDGAFGNVQSGNITIAADATLAIVCLSQRDTNASNFTANTATVTVDGASATQLIGVQTPDNITRSVMFYRLMPTTGSVTVAATGDTGSDLLAVGVMTFKGVAQTSTFNTAASNSNNGSSNADIDGLASAVGELAVMCGAIRSGTATPSPDATAPTSTEQVDYLTTGGVTTRVFGYTEDGASSSIDMRVDLSASERWAVTAASIRPAVSNVRRRGVVWLE